MKNVILFTIIMAGLGWLGSLGAPDDAKKMFGWGMAGFGFYIGSIGDAIEVGKKLGKE